MSEVKTVTHEGNVYEIGKDYLFSMNQLHWTYASLTDIDGGYAKVFCTQENEWRHIREIPASRTMGTITPAPIELIDGNAYTFDYRKASYIGLYEEQTYRFINVNGFTLSTHCTNIRRMTVEKK